MHSSWLYLFSYFWLCWQKTIWGQTCLQSFHSSAGCSYCMLRYAWLIDTIGQLNEENLWWHIGQTTAQATKMLFYWRIRNKKWEIINIHGMFKRFAASLGLEEQHRMVLSMLRAADQAQVSWPPHCLWLETLVFLSCRDSTSGRLWEQKNKVKVRLISHFYEQMFI